MNVHPPSGAMLAFGLGAALLSALAAGCPQNALFELYIEVPPPIRITGGSMRPATHVRLAVVADEADLMTDISGADSRVYPLRPGLTEADESWIGVTLVRGVAPETNPLTVRIVYCPSATECDREGRVGVQDIVIERAFYTGRRTCYAHFIDPSDRYDDGLALPSVQTRISACAVGGCTDAEFMPVPNFCDDTGAHFCASGSQGEYCETLRQRIGTRLVVP